jgi:hypothetical protein
MENCGSAVGCVIRFLRGLLINHDTPPDTSSYPIETGSPPGGVDIVIIAESDRKNRIINQKLLFHEESFHVYSLSSAKITYSGQRSQVVSISPMPNEAKLATIIALISRKYALLVRGSLPPKANQNSPHSAAGANTSATHK